MPNKNFLLNIEQLLNLLDQTVIISATDKKGVIIYANKKFCEISGYSREALIGSDHKILNSGRHSKSFFENLWKTLKEGKIWEGLICNRNIDEDLYYVKTTITPMKLEDGSIIYISVRKDITDEIAVQKNLEYFVETYQMASKSAHLGAWDWNIEKNTLYWNDQIYEIFEVEPHSFEATYEAFLSFCHPDDVDNINSAVQKSLSDPNIPYQLEHRAISSNGTIKNLLETGKVFRDDAGKPIRMIGIVQDITELSNQKNQLAHQKEQILLASKMSAIGEMAGSISHEINTPIAVILGNAEKTLRMLKDQKLDDHSEIKDSLNTIINTSMHISDIVKTLKRISRSEFHVEDVKEISIMEIIKDLNTISFERVKNRNIELYIEIENENEILQTNNPLIQQILINLLNNSMYAIQDNEEKWIKIRGKKIDGHYQFLICDSGHGIKPEVVEKMFQPFYTTKQVGHGSGVGLCVSLSYAQSLGGKLKYDSKSKNTCFVLEIPTKL